MTTNTRQCGKSAGDKNAGAGHLRQKSLALAGQPGQDSKDKTAGECRDCTGRTRKRGQDGQNMTEGQGSWDRPTEMERPWQDSHDSKVGA
jgi:hypothetical protein